MLIDKANRYVNLLASFAVSNAIGHDQDIKIIRLNACLGLHDEHSLISVGKRSACGAFAVERTCLFQDHLLATRPTQLD